MNLYENQWIPTTGRSPMASLRDLIEFGDQYESIECPPMSRLAVIRLLQALKAFPATNIDYFDLKVFLQVGGLPESSSRHPRNILEMIDGNSIAFSPETQKPIADKMMALALVTAYFCDRGGLKARVPGLPISAQTPPHVGKNVKLNRGASVAELLDNNPVVTSGDYSPPWHLGVLEFPKHDKPRDPLELVMWPWRRLQIFAGGITIAPGAPIDKSIVDPWSDGKSKISEVNEPADPNVEVTALVLNQALPIACWVR